MRNFQQASTQWKVLESGVSWLISSPMHLNSLLDGLPGVFSFTKCQETTSKLESHSLGPSNLGKPSIGFLPTAFHISSCWEFAILLQNWLPSNLGKCSIGFVWDSNHISSWATQFCHLFITPVKSNWVNKYFSLWVVIFPLTNSSHQQRLGSSSLSLTESASRYKDS